MVSLPTPLCNFGWSAPEFQLAATDGQQYNLASCRGERGLLLMFICNHCPYVQAVLDRIIRDCRELAGLGIGSVAIMANDSSVVYEQDSFANMVKLSREKSLPFPYLLDAEQTVARAYDAVCTPDFFGFNANLQLQYRGRLDGSGKAPLANASRELFQAMKLIAETGHGPQTQHPSIGCSIKWRNT